MKPVFLLTFFILLSIIVFLLEVILFRKPQQTSLNKKVKRIENALWDGPTPTEEEKRKNIRWVENFLERYPTSELGESYPEIKNKLEAIDTYLQLNRLLEKKMITQEFYDQELEKILPNIDITEDIS